MVFEELRCEVKSCSKAPLKELYQQEQDIIDALAEGGIAGPGRGHLLARRLSGMVQVDFSGTPGGTYLVEASTNMVHWEAIGVARHCGEGRFEFSDPHADKFPGRYYRVVTP